MSELEKKLLSENQRLVQENAFLLSLVQSVAEHLFEVVDDDWFCTVCGERAPMETDPNAFPHKADCVLYKK